MKTRILLGLLLSSVSCDHDDPSSLPDDPVRAAVEEAEGGPPAPALAGPAKTSMPAPANHEGGEGPPPVMTGARAAFDELTRLVDAEYVDGPLTEDELWTAAMEGVLARLVQLPGHEINVLMPPREHEELLIGTKGHLVGVGVSIEHVAHVVVVREVIPGGPAEQAGLRAGDRILGVGDERLEGLSMPEVVDRIRGPEGSTVDLFVQRDTEEWTETVTRGLVEVASVEGRMLGADAGYLRIGSFSEKTPAEVDAQLAALSEQGATRLVIDLRACPGGMLDASLQTISRFVPAGLPVLTVEPREGEPTVHRTEGEHPWQRRPVAVLIGPHTASGAEILADAIRTHGRGPLVGERTMGKHTIESIHELRGGWAVKLSVSRFATASGETRQGMGVEPDIHLPGPEDAEAKQVRLDELDPTQDAALATALGLLRSP